VVVKLASTSKDARVRRKAAQTITVPSGDFFVYTNASNVKQ
jgi:hypothetical protein